VAERHRVRDLIREAALALEGTDSGWVNPQVSQFRVLVAALAEITDGGPESIVEEARTVLVRNNQLFGQRREDLIISQFLDLTTQALVEFRSDPTSAISTGHLPLALETLAQIPLIGTGVAAAVAPLIAERAIAELLGPVKTWMHRTLESVGDESDLRKIILRLAQASLPRYSQVRHGPLEYGKDVVILLNQGGHRLPRMYQAKCGDITKQKWREAQSELEEIFLVSLPELQVPKDVDAREGILICNGHANPYVEPTMKAWFEEQKRAHNRDFKFMHLDDLVNWIVDDRLVNEFRAVLRELGIEPC
jgi:hypothetical protein